MKINSQKLYQLLEEIPKGKVTTYKELAQKLKTKSYRGVGQIVGANLNAPKIPCHRVVKSDGSIGGYAFGVKKKIEILQKEGIKIAGDKIIDFEKKLHKF
ncbi:MAG: MGMT family protein [Rickettsiales bacterium]|nr:MGMT family protein [Rickettsiales bacterium]